MNRPTRMLATAVCAATVALAGCGSTTSRSPTRTEGPTVPAQPATHYASQTTKVGRSTGAGAIVLPRLGTIRYSCAGQNGIDAVLVTRGVLATESAYVEGAGHQHLRGGTIQPGTSEFAVKAPTGGSELWHVVQSTEPVTLDARIAITVGSGCSAQWLARVGQISHAGTWVPPQPWL